MRPLGVVLAFWLLATGVQGQDAAKTAIPDDKELTRVNALLAELFETDFAQAAKDSAAKTRLAQTFLLEARDTKDDPAGRYGLLLQAYRMAAQVGDLNTALAAVEELARHYAVPAGELARLRTGVLQQTAQATDALPDAYRGVIDRAVLLLDTALANDEYAVALDLLATAETAARRLKNVVAVASLQRRQAAVRARQAEYARWKPFAERLAKNPDDAEANAEMGRYYALVRDDWERGLRLLRQGQDHLGQLASLETTESKTPRDRLAELWEKAARDLKGPMQRHALLHAYRLYLQALPTARAAERINIDQRLDAINAALPAHERMGAIARELRRLDNAAGPVYAAALSTDGKLLVASGYDHQLHLWNAHAGQPLRRLAGHTEKLWCVAVDPLGRRAVSGSFDGSLRLWDVAGGYALHTLAGHKDYVRSVALAGQHILSGGDDRTVRLWDADSGKNLKTLTGHDHCVWSVALSSDGTRALSGSLDKTVRLWDVGKGVELRKLIGHQDTVMGVALSPDGRHAASASTDGTALVWDLDTGKIQHTLTGHRGYVLGVAYAPDGRRLLTAGQDGTLRLWDARTGQQLHALEGHRDAIWSVAFSPDGRLAVSSGQDGTIRLWGGTP